jgi:predicted PurR-regulated permease PerM
MIKKFSTKNQLFFYAFFATLGALFLWLVNAYLDIIAFSLMMVIILKPVYDFSLRLLRGRSGLATTLTIIIFFLAIIIPGWLAMQVISNQAAEIVESLETPNSTETLTVDNLTNEANKLLAQTPLTAQWQINEEDKAKIQEAAQQVVLWISGKLVNLGMAIPDMLAKLFVFLAVVGVLLPTYHEFVNRLIQLSPFDDEIDRLYLRRIKAMVWAMFIGIAVIALVQGLTMGLFIWLAGVPYTPLWTLIAIVLSMLPLGASLVAIPMGIAYLLMGNPTAALIILAGYILVVSNLDSIVRPKLVSKEAFLDAALVLLGALGGYELFGFFGVVYGPVLIILLLTTIEVYAKYYAQVGEPETAISPEDTSAKS